MATATPAATNTTALSMKLLVDTKAQRVLFAEASKDVVDFLFSLLAVPVGTAVELLGKDTMAGCAGNLYAGAAKDGTRTLRLPEASSGQSMGLFKCGYCKGSYMTGTSGTKCPSCNHKMTTAVQFVSGSGGQVAKEAAGISGKGFVQDIVMYMLMDNLTVKPMSSISSIALLKSFAVKDLSALQEKTVQIGYKEGLEILTASLHSKTVLTDVFLGNKFLPGSRGGATPLFQPGQSLAAADLLSQGKAKPLLFPRRPPIFSFGFSVEFY